MPCVGKNYNADYLLQECLGGGSPRPPPPPPTKKEPPTLPYCTGAEDPNICTFAMIYRSRQDPADLTGTKGFIYDNKCNEIGHVQNVKDGMSITSELPYTIEIGTSVEYKPLSFYIVFEFSYAGQTINPIADDDTRCVWVNNDLHPSDDYIRSCQFSCPEKK